MKKIPVYNDIEYWVIINHDDHIEIIAKFLRIERAKAFFKKIKGDDYYKKDDIKVIKKTISYKTMKGPFYENQV